MTDLPRLPRDHQALRMLKMLSEMMMAFKCDAPHDLDDDPNAAAQTIGFCRRQIEASQERGDQETITEYKAMIAGALAIEKALGRSSHRPVHHFDSTGDAYNACQCREDIKTGDFLVIMRERVLGVAGAWPWAITENAGKLHELTDPENDAEAITARTEARAMELFDLIEEA